MLDAFQNVDRTTRRLGKTFVKAMLDLPGCEREALSVSTGTHVCSPELKRNGLSKSQVNYLSLFFFFSPFSPFFFIPFPFLWLVYLRRDS